MKNKLLAIIMSVAVVVNGGAIAYTEENFDGEGTKDSPYLISGSQDLITLSSLTNNSATAADYSDKYYKLTDDIDMTGVDYKPISYGTGMYTAQGAEFTGTFDGGGHIIKNVSIPSSAVSDYGPTVGIIGVLGGTVKNLGVENMVLNASGIDRACVGGIAGSLLNDVIIDRCYVNGFNITINAPGKVVYAGGIVGRTVGSAGQITNSYSNGITYSLPNENYAAGIIGGCGNTGYSATNCYTTHAKFQGWAASTNSYMGTNNTYAASNIANATAENLGEAFVDNNTEKNGGNALLSWESTEGYEQKEEQEEDIKDANFEGKGTEAAPFIINSVDKLKLLSDLSNTPAQVSYCTKYYKLTCDIDLSKEAYKPISFGTNMYTPQGAVFTGTFDGDGHIIKNVNIPSEVVPAYGCTAAIIGLLGGTVKNLGVENITITGGAVDRLCMGGIAGSLMEDAQITDCYVKGMNVTSTASTPYAGGIAGRTIGSVGTMENCYTKNINFSLTNQNVSAGILGSCGNTGYSAVNCYTTHSKIQGYASATNSNMGVTNCYVNVTPEIHPEATMLGEDFEEDEELINEGMPILCWEFSIAHPDTAYFTIQSNETDIAGREDVKKDETILIEFDRDMNTDTFSYIALYKNDELMSKKEYNFEILTDKQIRITLINAKNNDKYAIFVSKRVQSQKSGNEKSAKADEKRIEFRIEQVPKAVNIKSIKVNGEENWKASFVIGENITVEADLENISGKNTQSAALVVTLFNDGIMKYAALDTATLNEGTDTLEVSFKIPENIEISKSTQMNVLVLDGIVNMNAMGQIKTFK